MGEVIRKLNELQIGAERFDIELNNSTSTEGEREIHIQNPSFRLAVPESEFLQMCAAVLLAEKQLERIKGAEKLNSLREEL